MPRAHPPDTESPAPSGEMLLAVDLTRCQAYAQCCFLAPSVFQLHGEEALWYDPAPSVTLREHVLRAAAACPVQAIILGEPEDMTRQRRTPLEHQEHREEPHAAQRA